MALVDRIQPGQDTVFAIPVPSNSLHKAVFPPLLIDDDRKLYPRGGIRGMLKNLRDTWRDEIPPSIIIGKPDKPFTPYKFKARSTWFHNVVNSISLAISLGKVTDEALITKASEFITYCISDNFIGRKKTHPIEIAWGNQILTECINAIPTRRRRNLQRDSSSSVLLRRPAAYL